MTCLEIARAPISGLFNLRVRIRTRWRSEVNSNCRYRFMNSQTTASG
jgi:hypothetical protein